MSSLPASGPKRPAVKPGSQYAERGPNCYQCKHFAISWQPSAPYACRLLGFKSRVLPAIEVMRIDGRTCLGFTAKAVPLPTPKSVNTLA